MVIDLVNTEGTQIGSFQDPATLWRRQEIVIAAGKKSSAAAAVAISANRGHPVRNADVEEQHMHVGLRRAEDQIVVIGQLQNVEIGGTTKSELNNGPSQSRGGDLTLNGIRCEPHIHRLVRTSRAVNQCRRGGGIVNPQLLVMVLARGDIRRIGIGIGQVKLEVPRQRGYRFAPVQKAAGRGVHSQVDGMTTAVQP